jgi:precorrin-6B methylase 1
VSAVRGPASLTVVGVGIQAMGHTTLEAQESIRSAEALLYAVADPLAAAWLRSLNPQSRPLPPGEPGAPRVRMYEHWVEVIVAAVRSGQSVCAVFYGHPGVFVYASHEAVRRVRELGLPARMLPAVSAADCLYADLGIDPARNGCQSFEATAFLLNSPRFDLSTDLILWQIGAVGIRGYPEPDQPPPGLGVLAEVLADHYGPEHRATVYEAAHLSLLDPRIDSVALVDLAITPVSARSTLHVPPLAHPVPDPAMAERLGIPLVEAV